MQELLVVNRVMETIEIETHIVNQMKITKFKPNSWYWTFWM